MSNNIAPLINNKSNVIQEVTTNSESNNNQKRTSSKEVTKLGTKVENKANKSIVIEPNENEAPYCIYCVKKLNNPIVLTCKHSICYQCAIEMHQLNEFIKLEVFFQFEIESKLHKMPKL
jgi:hypothetical protein